MDSGEREGADRLSTCPTSSDERKAVLEPYEYLLSTPGKEFRTQLIDAFNKWLAVPSDTLQIIAKIVNMLHSASLM